MTVVYFFATHCPDFYTKAFFTDRRLILYRKVCGVILSKFPQSWPDQKDIIVICSALFFDTQVSCFRSFKDPHLKAYGVCNRLLFSHQQQCLFALTIVVYYTTWWKENEKKSFLEKESLRNELCSSSMSCWAWVDWPLGESIKRLKRLPLIIRRKIRYYIHCILFIMYAWQEIPGLFNRTLEAGGALLSSLYQEKPVSARETLWEEVGNYFSLKGDVRSRPATHCSIVTCNLSTRAFQLSFVIDMDIKTHVHWNIWLQF